VLSNVVAVDTLLGNGVGGRIAIAPPISVAYAFHELSLWHQN
jgi:hypothetical protein